MVVYTGWLAYFCAERAGWIWHFRVICQCLVLRFLVARIGIRYQWHPSLIVCQTALLSLGSHGHALVPNFYILLYISNDYFIFNCTTLLLELWTHDHWDSRHWIEVSRSLVVSFIIQWIKSECDNWHGSVLSTDTQEIQEGNWAL